VATVRVDHRQTVHVSDDHGQRAARPAGALELGFEQLFECPPVQEARERVDSGRVRQSGGQPADLVALVGDHPEQDQDHADADDGRKSHFTCIGGGGPFV
jgi:hypothetical protein